jgi:N-acyl amino acid synthase of PEP-CTERM/exosortase system
MTQTYSLILATTQKEFNAVKALRKEVLLEKYKHFASIEDEEAFAWDSSDEQSFLYLLQHRETGRYVGTIRVFFVNSMTPISELPMEHYTHAPRIKELKHHLPVCEISRFALSRNLANDRNGSALWTRIQLSQLLMVGIRLTVMIYPFNAIFAIMEHSLARLLRKHGAHFEQIGESVDYYGMRTPFFINRDKLLKDTLHGKDISCFYLHYFMVETDMLDRFITQNPYITKEMFLLNVCSDSTMTKKSNTAISQLQT